MSKQKLWYGFLEAGSKSSPVVIDHSMDTGETSSVFVYNHNRQEILKYVRELVEPKLRELTAKEKELESVLKKGFSDALKTLKYPLAKTIDSPAKAKPSPVTDTPKDEPEVEISVLDDDIWEDDD
ncbi:MAG: hypothetical protein RRB22_14545 [Gammaproteobacteria bacterium]|nr:hypothetical protein [Gammaproteobacteria bacterium]